MNRIHALFMVLEYVNVVSYAKYKRDGDTHVGGSLDYLAELERRRRNTPGLQFLLLADEHIEGNKDACRFWNSSCGCQNKACVFRHVCLACGRDLRWIDRHYKK